MLTPTLPRKPPETDNCLNESFLVSSESIFQVQHTWQHLMESTSNSGKISHRYKDIIWTIALTGKAALSELSWSLFFESPACSLMAKKLTIKLKRPALVGGEGG